MRNTFNHLVACAALMSATVCLSFGQQPQVAQLAFPTDTLNRVKTASPAHSTLSVYFGYSGAFRSLHDQALPQSTFEHSADVASFGASGTPSVSQFDAHQFINSLAPSSMAWTYFEPANTTIDLVIDVADSDGLLRKVTVYDLATSETLGEVASSTPQSNLQGTIAVASDAEIGITIEEEGQASTTHPVEKFAIPKGRFSMVIPVPFPVAFLPHAFEADDSTLYSFQPADIYDRTFLGEPYGAYDPFKIIPTPSARAGSCRDFTNDSRDETQYNPHEQSASLVIDRVMCDTLTSVASLLQFETSAAKAAFMTQIATWKVENNTRVSKPITAKPYSKTTGIWKHNLAGLGNTVVGIPFKIDHSKDWLSYLLQLAPSILSKFYPGGQLSDFCVDFIPKIKTEIDAHFADHTKSGMIFPMGEVLHVTADSTDMVQAIGLFQDTPFTFVMDKTPPTGMSFSGTVAFATGAEAWKYWTDKAPPMDSLHPEFSGDVLLFGTNVLTKTTKIQKGFGGKVTPGITLTGYSPITPGCPYDFTPTSANLKIPLDTSCTFNLTLKVLLRLKVFTRATNKLNQIVNQSMAFDLQKATTVNGTTTWATVASNCTSNTNEGTTQNPVWVCNLNGIAPGHYRVSSGGYVCTPEFDVVADPEMSVTVTRPKMPGGGPG